MPVHLPNPNDAPPRSTPPAYILAGGRSVRFGSDKARAAVNGHPLILHVARELAPFASSITAVAQTADHYTDLGLTTIADGAADNGPVQGLLAALIHHIETRGGGWLVLAACDMLTREHDAYRTLIQAIPDTPRGCQAIAHRTDRWHPMPGLYHTDMLPAVAAFLADGGRAFQTLLNKPALRAFAPHTHTHPLARLVHANTPGQLQAGLQQQTPPPTAHPDHPA
ncbi:MAG: molybdenum cofactor guanylyltransferase [Phycisphaerales bacterium JB063]